MISVVIPNYNGEASLARAIDSVLAQSVPDVEVVVIDDCSTDGSLDILRAYGAKVRTIRFDQNRGANIARNVGLEETSHRSVIFLDNDDYLMPGSLSAWHSELRETGVSAVLGPMLYETEGELSARASIRPHGIVSGIETVEAWLEDWVAPCSVLWDRGILKAIGGWSLEANRTRDQDGEIVFRAALHGARFFWSDTGSGVYVQHQVRTRVSSMRTPISYDCHYLWLHNLVRAARQAGDREGRFEKVFSEYGMSLARECYSEACIDQGRKFESLVAAKDVVVKGSIAHKLLVRCVGLRRKEALSLLLRRAASATRTCLK